MITRMYKPILWLIALTLLYPLMGCGDQLATDIEQDIEFIEKSLAGIEIRQYEVFDMTCKSCRFELEREIRRIPGVASARAHKRKDLLVIELEKGADIDDEQVLDVIQSVGLTPGKRLW